ncbi:Ribokinase-like protein [Choanephora cucurbitarum]|nr:Ribokinase-like protein [Choanephora cucurbitarum]
MAKILNYGSSNIDEFFIVPHICQSGETLSSTQYVVRAGGKGVNQSVGIAKAGGCVYHAGNLGNDGKWIKDMLHENGVDVSFVNIKENEKNGRALIQVSEETGDNCIVLYPGSNATYKAEEAKKVLSSFGPGDWIVQQNEISEGGKIMSLAAEKGLSVLFNPAPLTKGILKEFPFDKVTVLVVNEHEAEALLNELNQESKKGAQGLDLANELLNTFENMQGVILTLGGEGVVAKFRQKDKYQEYRLAAKKVAVKDTTGAGDTFVGFFLAGLLRDQSEELFKRVERALEEANTASSLAVQREGSSASVPTIEEVNDIIQNEQ